MKRKIKKLLVLISALISASMVHITYLGNTENIKRRISNREKYDNQAKRSQGKGDFMYINGVGRFLKPFRKKTSASFGENTIREKDSHRNKFISRCRQWLKDSALINKTNIEEANNVKGDIGLTNPPSKNKKCTETLNTKLEDAEISNLTKQVTNKQNPLHALTIDEQRQHEIVIETEKRRHRYFGPELRPMLTSWHQFSAANNVSYFLTAGSLIGAFLHEDALLGDSDIDIMIDREDIKNLAKVQSKRNFQFNEEDDQFRLILQRDWQQEAVKKRRRFTCDGSLTTYLEDTCSFQDPIARLIRNMMYIDIFDYHLEGHIFKWYGDKTKPVNQIFPLKECRFMNLTTFCPHNSESFLKTHYGEERYNQILREDSNRFRNLN
ncbi:uncharacterized protein [Clytia hemisphaerica]|uniref:uncharacterized protein n=1 Tax=Clytia hemisphaerica TaxID=252671 RepID=UPI0034D3FA4C